MTVIPPPPGAPPPAGPGRPGRPPRPGRKRGLLGLLLAALGLAVVAAGFAVAVSLDRSGPCKDRLSSSGGRPHYVMVCGKRAP